MLASLGFEAGAFSPDNTNTVMLENQKSGTADWGLTNPATYQEIEGYASLTSVNRGGQIGLLVNTTNSAYQLEVFRLGWYGGAGARRVYGPLTMVGSSQTIPTPDPVTGLVECNWTNPCILNIPANPSDPTDWASGVYLARLTGSQDGKQSYIIFAVRDDARNSSLLVQMSFATYAAYNNWGGKSLYDVNSDFYPTYGAGGFQWFRAAKVSFNRPFAAPPWSGAASWQGAGEFFGTLGEPGYECNLVRWLEREGYDVSYCSSVDTHTTTNLLWSHKAFLSMGHDEYWSYPMRWNTLAARDRGINLGFFGANDCYRQIRFEPSTLDGAPDRNIVCYKSTLDPVFQTESNYLTTVEFRNYPVYDLESSLLGVSYDLVGDNGDMVVSDPNHWIFAGTGASAGQRLPGLLGSEADSTNAASPADVAVAFVSPYMWSDHLSSPTPTLHYCDAASYIAPSGAMVFAAGSMHWSWGLDDLNTPGARPTFINPVAEQITRNILARLTDAPAPSPNFFFRADAATLGNWKPVYGIEGFAVPGDATNVPGFATLSVNGAAEEVYLASSTDPNCLQRSKSTTSGLGGWSSATNFVFDLNLADGRNHQLGLYCWDWNQAGRTQQVDVLDAATGTVIDRQILTGFTNGQWWVWQVNGHVQVRVISLAGPDCLVNALMLGSGSAARFISEDTLTQGDWKGWYGSECRYIMGDSPSQPSCGSLAPYTTYSVTNWVFFLPEPRALQSAGSTNLLLAALTGDCSFNLNLADNGWHQLAIYCVDVEGLNRKQVVSLYDTANNAMLDSRPMTDFSGGKYLTWNVCGNVRIQLQSLTSAPAVLAAVFLDPPNQPPTVSLATPIESQHFFLPTNVVLQANAADADGVISQVSFYTDTVCLGIVTNAPFSLLWTNAPVGQHDLYAVAMDDRRASVASTPITVFVESPSAYQPPAVQVISPADGAICQGPTNFLFLVSCDATSAPIVSVQFLLDGVPLGPALASGPFVMRSGYLNAGPHTVSALVVDAFGLTTTSPSNRVTVLPATASSIFRDYDSDDRGSWNGLCGADGYLVAGLGTNLPAYALATPPASDYFLWASATNDPRGLQLPGNTNRLLSAWYTYTNGFLDVNLLDGIPHRVTLYVVDGGAQGGSETVQVTDPATAKVLDSRTVTDLTNGTYLIWDFTGHVQLQLSRTPASLPALLSGVFFDPPRGAPEVRFLSPVNGASYAAPTSVVIIAQASFGPASLSRFELLINGTMVGTMAPGPQSNFIWTNPPPGTYALTARAVDTTGATTLSDPIFVTIEPTSAGAVFAGTDTTDQGTWLGRFGRQGYWIAGDSTNPAPYLSLTPVSQVLQWASDTTDARALWRSSGTSRVAAAWYDPKNLLLDVKCSDATFHRFTLYCLDWSDLSGAQWAQWIDVIDNISGAVLDHRVLPPFANGIWLAWDVKGHLRFQLQRTGGSPALLSGIFLDASPILPAISITNPVPGSIFVMPANVSVTADAAADPNNVWRVDFYDGATLLGSISNGPPYTYLWTNAPFGEHSLWASQLGPAGLTNSDPVLISVFTPTNMSIVGSALQPDGTLLLNAFGPPGQLLRLEAASDLGPNANWIPLLSNISGAYLFNITLGDPTNYSRRFYRLVLLP